MSVTTPVRNAARKPNVAPIEHPIRSNEEYEAIVCEIDALVDGDHPEGTREYDRLELLSVLVEAYEDEHVPEPKTPTPQEVVEFMAEQRGLSQGDLALLMGGRSRLSEFINGKRALSIGQIRMLREELGIPADLLIA